MKTPWASVCLETSTVSGSSPSPPHARTRIRSLGFHSLPILQSNNRSRVSFQVKYVSTSFSVAASLLEEFLLILNRSVETHYFNCEKNLVSSLWGIQGTAPVKGVRGWRSMKVHVALVRQGSRGMVDGGEPLWGAPGDTRDERNADRSSAVTDFEGTLWWREQVSCKRLDWKPHACIDSCFHRTVTWLLRPKGRVCCRGLAVANHSGLFSHVSLPRASCFCPAVLFAPSGSLPGCARPGLHVLFHLT